MVILEHEEWKRMMRELQRADEHASNEEQRRAPYRMRDEAALVLAALRARAGR